MNKKKNEQINKLIKHTNRDKPHKETHKNKK